MTRFIWALVGLNTLALIIFIIAFFVLTSGKHVDYMEGGWTIILCVVALIIILLAALPLRYGHSTFSRVFAFIFAALPLFIAAWFFLSKKISSLKRKETFARVFFEEPAQRAIASAIERGDAVLLRKLIKGQDLKVRGTKVNDEEGFNYLQFAVHVRSNPIDFPFNDEASQAMIRILLAAGSPINPALQSATRYLPPQMVEEFLRFGADPNTKTTDTRESLLFENLGSDSVRNDIALVLLRYGADVNTIDLNGYTPLMKVADNADTSVRWYDGWRVARYILEQRKADIRYSAPDGKSFISITREIERIQKEKGIISSPDFSAVLRLLPAPSTIKP